MRAKKTGSDLFKDQTATKPAVPPESDKEQKRNLAYLVVLAANIEGKAAVSVMLDDQLVASHNLQAPSIIKEQVAPLIKGGGGGQKTLATAGGQEAGNLPQVIARVETIAELAVRLRETIRRLSDCWEAQHDSAGPI